MQIRRFTRIQSIASHDSISLSVRLKPSFYNIYHIKRDVCFIYNTATGAVVEIPLATWESKSFSAYERTLLFENGFLVREEVNEFEGYLNRIHFGGKLTPNFFTIIPTTSCNARCFYCYEEHYDKTKITEESHKKIVSYLTETLCNQSKFTFDWYGGEPLTAVNEIDRIIHDLDAELGLFNYHWTSSITTNATLFTPSLLLHAVHDWNLQSAHITLDGTENEHNRRKRLNTNGVNAYRKTLSAVRALLSENVFVNLRIHLDHGNKHMYPDILEDINDILECPHFHLFPTYLFPPEQEMPPQYITDSEKEALFYDVYRCMYEHRCFSDYIDELPWPKVKNCFATDPKKVVIAPDGSLHACVQDFQRHSSDDDIFYKYADFCRKCSSCSYFPICLGGCIYNRTLSNTVRTPCVRNRYIIKPLLRLISESIINANDTASLL